MTHAKSIMDNFSLKDPVLISNLMLFPIVAVPTVAATPRSPRTKKTPPQLLSQPLSPLHSLSPSSSPEPPSPSPPPPPQPLSFKTLEEGLKERQISVDEPGGGYSSVLISNLYTDYDAFIIDGEGISGGKQNRIAASSLIIWPQKTKIIPVFCSEQGRWAGSDKFNSSNSIAYPSVRRLYTSTASQSYSTRDAQSSVWSSISATMKSLSISSPTQSMQEIYVKKEADLERFMEYEPQENQVGFMAATHKKILCIDIFYNHILFGKLRAKLLISYALDALNDARSTKGSYNVKKCEKFYRSLSTAHQIKKYKRAPEDHYMTDTAIGKALFHKGRLIHASFFPKVSSQ